MHKADLIKTDICVNYRTKCVPIPLVCEVYLPSEVSQSAHFLNTRFMITHQNSACPHGNMG